MVYGIVVGGDMEDPAGDQSGNVRVYFPGIHGKNVDIKHLAFSTRLMGPDRHSQQSFSGGLDPGSMVVCMKDTGSNSCQIVGLANDVNKRDSMVPGATDLLENISHIFSRPTGVMIPPKIKAGTKNGIKNYGVVEQKEHNHDLTRGLPTHAALFPMAGAIIPQVKGIATAIESTLNIPGADVLSLLPGVAISIGSLFDTLTSTRKYTRVLNKKMNPGSLAAFTSMSVLLQTVEDSESAGFMPSGRVNPDVFAANAIDLLVQCNNLSDIMHTTQRLQYDTSLHGMDAYGPTIIPVQSQYGLKFQSFHPTSGDMLTFAPAAVAIAESLAGEAMGGFPSSIPGVNLFGGSAGTMMKMFNRLPAGDMGKAIALGVLLNESGVASAMSNGIKEVANGGNPLTKIFE
jgi:hypothetical protein